MWHRECGKRHSRMFHFCDLLIQVGFRSAPVKDDGDDCAQDSPIMNPVVEATRFMKALIML